MRHAMAVFSFAKSRPINTRPPTSTLEGPSGPRSGLKGKATRAPTMSRRRCLFRAAGLAFAFGLGLALLLAPAATQAATKTWSGAGADNNWATAANWVGGVAPISGDKRE